ncbi:flaEY, partial [Symbiodinium necroappetens]
VDGSDNIFVAGYTNGDLGNVNAGEWDLFLIKFDSTGTWKWTSQHGSSNNDVARTLQIDGSGNIYVAGFANGPLDGQAWAGLSDIFLMKFDNQGTKQWTVMRGSSGNDDADALQ